MNPELKQFKIERLDPLGPTFCAAKWLFSDIYLHTGVTSSCHFPYPHKINLDKISTDPLFIHNTDTKVEERKLMIEGKQPSVCSNCWNIENISNEVASARIWYSKAVDEVNFKELHPDTLVVPQLISVVFDTYCNFKCSYCDGSQSSTWNTDLKTFGPIKTNADPKNTYLRTGDEDLLPKQEYNILLDGFINMVVNNLSEIKQINVLGGEPTMSPGFWKFLDMLVEQDVSNLTLSITTNGSRLDSMIKFSKYAPYFKKMSLGISIDGTESKAEFVRAGLNWKEFLNNINYLLDNTNLDVNFLGTLNVLALDGLIDNLNWYIEKRKKHHSRVKLVISVCRWPVFQTIDVLPSELKTDYIKNLKLWLQNNQEYCNIELVENVNQIIELLAQPAVTNIDVLQQDLRLFVNEFSRRNNLDITTTFSKSLTDWLLLKE